MTSVTLGSDKFTFEELERKYRNFIAPGFKLMIQNVDAVRHGMAITQLSVETTATQEADTVSFTVGNAYDLVKRDFEWLDDLLVLGKPVEVHMGYTDRMTPLFYGYITAVNIGFAQGGAPQVQVTGMDLSFKMMRGRSAKTFANRKISDVAREIGQLHGANRFVIDATSKPIPVLPRKPENDYQFLHDLAQAINYEFFIVGTTIYFRKKNMNKNPLMTLEWGKHLMRFDVEQNLAEQVSRVKVRSWDAKTQRVIEASSSRVNRIGGNTRTGADLLKTMGNYEEVLYVNAQDMQEAQMLADAAMNERAMRLVYGEAECIGIPEIRAGRYIRLDGLGRRLNQPYYISRARHTISGSGYVTEFTVQGNAV